jgi:hypothetical protein
MISSETPHKLAEIIRDTWPGLYRPIKQNDEDILKDDDKELNE